MGIGVDFDHRAGRGGRVDDRVEVDGVAVASQQEPARGMAEHRDSRVGRRPDQPARHLVARQAENRMDARDHVVETVEQLVGIIERAVGQDVALGPLEESELAAERLVERVDLGPLLADPLDGQPAGIARPNGNDRRSPGNRMPRDRAASAISASVADPSLQSVWQ